MAGTPAYNSTLKTGGTPTAFAGEATTKITANTVYQLTDAAKRVLDPETAVVVEVDADGGGAGGYADADPTSYTLDYHTGKVTFLVDQGAAAVVRFKSGKYLPKLTVATCRNASVEYGREELDDSVFGMEAPSAMAGRKFANVSLEVVEDLTTDHDAGAGEVTLAGLILAGSPVYFEHQPGGAGPVFRAWVLFPKGSVKSAVQDLTNASLSGKAVAKACVGRSDYSTFSWAT